MSLFRIALRSIQQRGFASFLTMFSMALGVMLVVAVLTIHGVVSQSFQNSASLGYNIIVGANKGGKLQITLNTVYYLSRPVENLPYSFFAEFLPQDQRDAVHRESVRARAYSLHSQVVSHSMATAGSASPGLGQFAIEFMAPISMASHERRLDIGRDGIYAQFTGFVIPVCLGDYFGHFRVIGTTPDMFVRLRYGQEADRE